MKKLFEVLFIFVFSFTFSGTLFSNSLNKNLEKEITTDFIRLYEINDNTTETVSANQVKTTTNHFVTKAADVSYTELKFDVALPITQKEISILNYKSDTVSRFSSISLDVETIPSFNVFPNPATDKLFVRFNGWSGEKEIKLIDLTGRSVFIMKSVEEINEINISSFPKGIYIINVKNEFHRVVQKIKIQ